MHEAFVDLVLDHHAHVVQPFERINGKWVAYGLGNHIAEQDLPATRDSVIARFTFTRGPTAATRSAGGGGERSGRGEVHAAAAEVGAGQAPNQLNRLLVGIYLGKA
jgi:Bacterial capsule synthesis protein PGA_cap